MANDILYDNADAQWKKHKDDWQGWCKCDPASWKVGFEHGRNSRDDEVKKLAARAATLEKEWDNERKRVEELQGQLAVAKDVAYFRARIYNPTSPIQDAAKDSTIAALRHEIEALKNELASRRVYDYSFDAAPYFHVPPSRCVAVPVKETVITFSQPVQSVTAESGGIKSVTLDRGGITSVTVEKK